LDYYSKGVTELERGIELDVVVQGNVSGIMTVDFSFRKRGSILCIYCGILVVMRLCVVGSTMTCVGIARIRIVALLHIIQQITTVRR
jgi:hypothetical protein